MKCVWSLLLPLLIIAMVGVVNAVAPDAEFSANKTTICAGEVITFTDESTGIPTVWDWDVEGDFFDVPSFEYSFPFGNYSVNLTVTNADGSDYVNKPNYITVISCPATIPTTGSFTVRAELGETWIKYYWTAGYNVTVFINGVNQTTNPGFHDYYLPYLNPVEKHQIKLFNSTNSSELLGQLTVTTLYPLGIIMVLICFLIVFIILLIIFANDPIKTILIGCLTLPLSLYTSQIAVGYGAITIIPLVTLVISAIFIIYALWNIIIEKTRW
jgi:hypothetical protein